MKFKNALVKQTLFERLYEQLMHLLPRVVFRNKMELSGLQIEKKKSSKVLNQTERFWAVYWSNEWLK